MSDQYFTREASLCGIFFIFGHAYFITQAPAMFDEGLISPVRGDLKQVKAKGVECLRQRDKNKMCLILD